MPTREGSSGLRIELVLEPLGISNPAVELAVHMARLPGGQLAAVMIEDTNLIRAVSLPFARELTARLGEDRAIEREILLSRLDQQARRLRSALEQQAKAQGVSISFRTLRTAGIGAVLAATGSPIRAMIFGRAAGARTHDVRGPESIVMAGAERDAGALGEALRWVSETPFGAGLPVTRLGWTDVCGLLDATRRYRAAVLIAPAVALRPAELQLLLERLECPLLLVGLDATSPPDAP